MNQIFDRASASPMMRRLLDDHAATQYSKDDNGALTIMGDGWSTSLSAGEVGEQFGGRLVGWRLIRRAEYPKREVGQ